MASGKVGIGRKILGAAKKVAIGDSPDFIRFGRTKIKPQNDLLDLPGFIEKSPRLKKLVSKLHYQDTQYAGANQIKKFEAMLKKKPGSHVYVDINADDRTAKMHNKLRSLAKKYGATLHNVHSPKTHGKIEDKIFMENAMKGFGAGGTKQLKGRKYRDVIKALKDPKIQDDFVKQRAGYGGTGVQQVAGALSGAERKQVAQEVMAGKKYIHQKYIPTKGEFRVHTSRGKVVDITSRNGDSIATTLNPLVRRKAKA